MRRMILIMMLTMVGCGERQPGSETEDGAAPAQNTSLNSQFAAGPLAPEEKFAALKRKAEGGDARSQMGLARMYYNGDGVTKDDAMAAEWYRKAAEQGDAFSQYKLGAMYDRGEGVPKDAAKAVEWWQKAAEQGNAAAQESLRNASAAPPG